MSKTLKHSINLQRALLNDLLSTQLDETARSLGILLSDQVALDMKLRTVFMNLDHCKYIYVLDLQGIQISSTINRFGADEETIGRDRSARPYLQHINNDPIVFNLSEAYISRNKKRPSVTAIQPIVDQNSKVLGFLGVDYDLRELPQSNVIYEEPRQWRQIRGDPAIRGGLFSQQRTQSIMDSDIDTVLSVHKALMVDHGVHHCQIHFSSSRSTIWHRDDPFVYRILTMEELSDPDTCFAYPTRSYLERAIVPAESISKILNLFKALRYEDDTVYLRSGSLNTVNGKIGLNFSCDGTHYLDYDEFLRNGLDFWFGGETISEVSEEALDFNKLDILIEEIAGSGCIKVNKLLYSLEQNKSPVQLNEYDSAERQYIYRELKTIMDVYE